MLELEDCARLLRLQDMAYRLLLHVSERAAHDAEVLDPTEQTRIHDGETCAEWLKENRRLHPAPLWPGKAELPTFANLFSSLFRDSFGVRIYAWDGRLLGATLSASERPSNAKKRRAFQAQAVKRLARAESGRRLSWDEARRVSDARTLAAPVALWSWVFELSRRAEGRISGDTGRSLWRAIPRETREALSAEAVIEARDLILDRIHGL